MPSKLEIIGWKQLAKLASTWSSHLLIIKLVSYWALLSQLPAVSRENIASFFHKINPLGTKLVQSIWLDIGIVLFCVFMDLGGNSADVMVCWRYALCWLASFYYLLYFLGLDWLRQTVLYFLNWTVCLFLKENSYLKLSKLFLNWRKF